MRISCTQIEAFRLFMDPANDWMREADLIATIEGRTADTPAMALGRAFESILMDPERYRVPHGFTCGGYTFADADMAAPLELVDRRGVFQVKAQQAYGDCDVVAKADQIVGASIHEWKTTTSTFNVDKYLHSCQTPFMLDIFQAAEATYHVFVLDDHENGVVEVRSIESVTVYPYPALHADCAARVAAFRSYVVAKGLDGGLRARQQAAEAA